MNKFVVQCPSGEVEVTAWRFVIGTPIGGQAINNLNFLDHRDHTVRVFAAGYWQDVWLVAGETP